MDKEKYAEYVNSHTEEIAEYVNSCFEESKDFIKAKIIKQINKYLSPVPVHYEWELDDDPYDHSGILVQNGLVNLSQTLSEFFENEYTGKKMPTFESGRGFDYETYGDDLHYFSLELGCQMMNSGIKRFLEEEFGEALSEEDFGVLQDECDMFDEIYDSSITSDFFWYEGVLDFLEIGGKSIQSVMKNSK